VTFVRREPAGRYAGIPAAAARPSFSTRRLGAGIADVKRACAEVGRNRATLGVALLVQSFFEWGDYKTLDGSARRFFTGTLGVGHVALRLGGKMACVARIERFGTERAHSERQKTC